MGASYAGNEIAVGGKMLVKNQNWYSKRFQRLMELEKLIARLTERLDRGVVKYPENVEAKLKLYKASATSLRYALGMK